MFSRQWNFSTSPFCNSYNTRFFHESLEHEESLARLLFLIEQRRKLGILSGPAGMGKSFVMRVIHEQLDRSQRQPVFVNLNGLDSDELVWEIASQLALTPDNTQSPAAMWQEIKDSLAGAHFAHLQTVFLFDHVDLCEQSTASFLRRLYQLNFGGNTWTTILLATHSESISETVRSFQDLADLSVKLSPLDEIETGNYVQALLQKAGCEQSLFSHSSVAALHGYSAGIPATINRLCDLSLVAGLTLQRETIDESIVDAAAQELEILGSTAGLNETESEILSDRSSSFFPG
jgi:general secretion pathway protein A